MYPRSYNVALLRSSWHAAGTSSVSSGRCSSSRVWEFMCRGYGKRALDIQFLKVMFTPCRFGKIGWVPQNRWKFDRIFMKKEQISRNLVIKQSTSVCPPNGSNSTSWAKPVWNSTPYAPFACNSESPEYSASRSPDPAAGEARDRGRAVLLHPGLHPVLRGVPEWGRADGEREDADSFFRILDDDEYFMILG